MAGYGQVDQAGAAPPAGHRPPVSTEEPVADESPADDVVIEWDEEVLRALRQWDE